MGFRFWEFGKRALALPVAGDVEGWARENASNPPSPARPWWNRVTEDVFFRDKRKPEAVLSAIGKKRGRIVLSYLAEPFVASQVGSSRGHTNWQECVAMATAWREAGFEVLVIDRKNRDFVPTADTAAVVDLGVNLSRWADALPSECTRILHATGAHWLTQSYAELTRLERLRQRRGVALLPRRQNIPHRGVENADRVVVLGNSFTEKSFGFAGRPITRVPISSAYTFDWMEGKDWESARRKFLWLGSFGMVHKGLDLVLEAVASNPRWQLTICGRPEKEEDFYSHYLRELTQLPNIRLAGWMDLASAEFDGLRREHGSVVYPSCSEGGGGAVIHCMHAGLVPVVTDAASVDIGEFGLRIAEDTPAGVASAMEQMASASPDELQSRSREAWEFARNLHTIERFTEVYRTFLATVFA